MTLSLTCLLCRPCTSRHTLRTEYCLCACPGSKKARGGRTEHEGEWCFKLDQLHFCGVYM